MELVLIKPESNEWNYMWDWLAEHPINKGLDNPSLALNDGEGWMYMGSYQQDKRVIHTFRHRNHPVTNTIQNVSVQGNENLTEEQIEKRIKK